MNKDTLIKTAKTMVQTGKGLLAMDESNATCKKRFDQYGIECNEENRRAYREMLLTAPGLEQYISGAILYDETIRQKTTDGMPFHEYMMKKGILVGIKVDAGAKDFALHPGEKITEGLDGLRERLAEYKNFGAVFAKWRAVITIGKDIPSDSCIKANAHAMARYAALCQESDIVPIVEPEVLIDGDHTIEKSFEITSKTLEILFKEIVEQDVLLEGTILKASMVISGKSCPTQASTQEVAKQTLQCLKENVPANLGGVVFLSGGQTDEKATAHLNEMHKLDSNLPWALSFSYSRALQALALQTWAENIKDYKRSQGVLLHRAKMNSLAATGKYEEAMEKEVPAQ